MSKYLNDIRSAATIYYADKSNLASTEDLNIILEFIDWLETQREEGLEL